MKKYIIYTITIVALILFMSFITMIMINFFCYIANIKLISFLDSIFISSGFLLIKIIEEIILYKE